MKLYCFYNKNNSLVVWATGSADYETRDENGNILQKKMYDVLDTFEINEENVKNLEK